MVNEDRIVYAHPYEKCIDFLKSSLIDRDKSHGIEHALAVHKNCVELWFHHGGESHYYDMIAKTEKDRNSTNVDNSNNFDLIINDVNRNSSNKDTNQLKFDPWFFISASALLHDVCDHKYKISETFEEAFHEFILNDVCHGNKGAADIISIIIEFVSYSKEKKGFLKQANLPVPIMTLRDVVSDADKLEALGEMGIQRCIEYTKTIMEQKSINDSVYLDLVMKGVAQHCDEKLLHLLPEYIRTPGGKEMGKPLHDYVAKWKESHSRGILCEQ